MKTNKMFNLHSVEIDWGCRPLRLETVEKSPRPGCLAWAVLFATYCDTVVSRHLRCLAKDDFPRRRRLPAVDLRLSH